MLSVDKKLQVLSVALSIAAVAPAFAQQDGSVSLEEVVVTAQRREQKLQEVPIAVTALSAAQLEQRGVRDVTGLNALAPNLQVTTAAGSHSNAQVGIRGGIEINGNILTDPTVGLYVDGVFIGKAVGSIFQMLDLERVEVLRGPQGTLYGRNTLAGAINFVTKKPTGVFGGTAGLEVGNYNAHTLRASIDLPAYGIVKASISGRSERRDGWVKVVPDPYGNYTGPTFIPDTNDVHVDAGRAALDFDFSDVFKAAYRFDISSSNQNHVYDQIPTINDAFFSAVGIPQYSLYVRPESSRADSYSTNLDTFEVNKVTGHSLTLAYDIADHLQLKSISGYRTLKRQDRQDQDGSPLDIGETTLDIHYHAFSQELQALGSTDRWNYVAGAYYSKDNGYTNNYLNFFGFFGPFAAKTDWMYSGGTETFAGYMQADFKATDKLTLTAGVRYTKEKKDFQRFVHQLAGPGAEVTGSGWRDSAADPLNPILPAGVTACRAYGRDAACAHADFSATTPAFSIAYKLTEALNLYARYAEGYKSGGYNGETNFIAEVETPFKPVKQKSYEVGAKSSFWDGRAQVNAAVFENKAKDLQLSVFLGGASVANAVRNAGKSTVRGFELEAALQLTPGWRFGLGYGYLDPKFDEFIDGGVNVANNRAFPHAPKHTISFNFDGLLWNTGFGRLRLLGDYSYVASNYYYPYPLVPENAGQQKASNTLVAARGIANAKLLLSDIPAGTGQAEIALWIRNLTDKEYVENTVDFGPGFGGLTQDLFGTPRTYGAEFVYRW